jgi:hypothetical protein
MIVPMKINRKRTMPAMISQKVMSDPPLSLTP